ncbi:MAG: glucose-6-phosphate isomerase [Alphaproteobacteria bacterium CG1_02_46_17]|nr:MAG: glucose-6-phosphate isomerase [Alphaproteobacteria bacterium CG1_02_46_17]
MTQPTELSSWKELTTHHHDMRDFSLREELGKTNRFDQLSIHFQDMMFDFSKHLATNETIKLLTDLARQSGVEKMRDLMFAGSPINNTENRAVLHIACRAPKSASIMVNGENVIPFIHQVLGQMEKFSNAVRAGIHTGYTGHPITDVVNIGIGGSDLGPRYVVDALQDFCDGPKVHFVSNVDGSDINATLKNLDASTTIFIIASKTFTTEETMLNAQVAKDWFLKFAPQDAIEKHFVALSTNLDAVRKFGISEENMFPFRDWVGGRYSLWSAIGLSITLAVGFERFCELLDGARAMDEHFLSAPLNKNIPVLMGLLGIWYRNFYGYPTHLLLPYDRRLGKMAKFTQQMDMESNGKAIDRDGHHVDYATGPVIFGEPGTDSQHSFMQLVHQSPTPIPADIILCKNPAHDLYQNHISLMANCLAQTRALAIGQTLEEAGGDPSRIFTGNRPSTTIILPQLDPFHLGALIAAYEHKVFVQGIVWNLNSFDQPGVELGKILAKPIRRMIEDRTIEQNMDCSTKALAECLIK